MITRDEFNAGTHETAKREVKSVIDKIERGLEAGNKVTYTYASFNTPTPIVIEGVKRHVSKYGWSLNYRYEPGTQRDGLVHIWTLI